MRFLLPLLIATAPCSGASTEIFAAYFGGSPPAVENDGGTALPVGSVIQIGHFAPSLTSKDPATFTPEDWATFTPLTGDDSSNPGMNTAIGDGGELAGYFNISAMFDPAAENDVPTSAVRIGIKFFNGASVGTATHFNLVTSNDAGWILQPPSEPPPSASAIIGFVPIVWQTGDAGFATTIPLTTPAVTPVITSVVATGTPNEFLLTYDATPGVPLDIETSTTTGGWGAPASGNTSATPSGETGNTVTVTAGPADGARFWRLRVP